MRAPVEVYAPLSYLVGFGALMLLIGGFARIALQIQTWVKAGTWDPDPLIGPIDTGSQGVDLVLTSIAAWPSVGGVLLVGAVVAGMVTLRCAARNDKANGREWSVRRAPGLRAVPDRSTDRCGKNSDRSDETHMIQTWRSGRRPSPPRPSRSRD